MKEQVTVHPMQTTFDLEFETVSEELVVEEVITTEKGVDHDNSI